MRKYKNFIFIFLIISLVFNIYNIKFSRGLLSEENRPVLIGLFSSILGIITLLIYSRATKLEENIKKRYENKMKDRIIGKN